MKSAQFPDDLHQYEGSKEQGSCCSLSKNCLPCTVLRIADVVQGNATILHNAYKRTLVCYGTCYYSFHSVRLPSTVSDILVANRSKKGISCTGMLTHAIT